MAKKQPGERGHDEGRKAYLEEKSDRDNPYDSAVHLHTDEGLARQGWLNGYRFEWFKAGCPADRWPAAANTQAAVERCEDNELQGPSIGER